MVLFEERPKAAPGSATSGRPERACAGGAAFAGRSRRSSPPREHSTTDPGSYGRATDALASANDDSSPANEELQSLNEEMETAKEELQATNEELTTVNDELPARNQDLLLVNADVLNLLDTVEIPVLMLDLDQGTALYPPRREFMALTPAAVGKRITTLPFRSGARPRAVDCTGHGEVHPDGVGDPGHFHHWHRLQVRPHLASDGRTDGAILSLVDIEDLQPRGGEC